MFERFTNQSRYAIVAAQEEARSLNHSHIGSEHLLLGLLREDQGTAAPPLASAGITLEAARQVIDELVGRGERPPPGHIPFTKPAKQCLELALREALQLGHRYIGTGHLLLGLIDTDDSVAVTVLGRLGADLDQLRPRVIQELEDHPEDSADAAHAVLATPLRPPDRPTPRPTPPPGIMASLRRIEERLAAIERHLGIAGENVVPPS
jgi:ATP-dependent Clp protease ATP-binding subunit ClpC